MARAGSGRPRAKVTGTPVRSKEEKGEYYRRMEMKGPLELHKTCMAKMTMTSTK
jgi:hypothetical protein